MVCHFEMTLKQSDDRINLYGVDDVVMELNALQEIEFGFGYGSVIGGRREGVFARRIAGSRGSLGAIFQLTPNSKTV